MTEESNIVEEANALLANNLYDAKVKAVACLIEERKRTVKNSDSRLDDIDGDIKATENATSIDDLPRDPRTGSPYK